MASDNDTAARGEAFDGTPLICTKGRWRHIVDRHKELKGKLQDVVAAASTPDEIYLDPHGMIHAFKRTKTGPSEYLVVLLRRREQAIFIITAYYTSGKRAKRRYRRFKKLERYWT